MCIRDRSVVGHKSLTDGVRASDEGLQDLEGDGNDLWVSSVQGSLDWDNKLRNDGQDLGATGLKHIEDTLHGEEAVWVSLLSDTLEEDGQVVVVIELLDLDFPLDAVLRAVLNCNWQISSVVEESEFTDWDLSSVHSSGLWLLYGWLFSWLVQTCAFSSESITLLEDGGSSSSN